MISTFELGDVWVCVFPFTSGQGAKARPVLVSMDLGGIGRLLPEDLNGVRMLWNESFRL